jgi:hypothetical protein
MQTIRTILSKDNVIPAVVAVFVPAFLSVIGFGIYHGTMHVNANTTHCHQDICHNH